MNFLLAVPHLADRSFRPWLLRGVANTPRPLDPSSKRSSSSSSCRRGVFLMSENGGIRKLRRRTDDEIVRGGKFPVFCNGGLPGTTGIGARLFWHVLVDEKVVLVWSGSLERDEHKEKKLALEKWMTGCLEDWKHAIRKKEDDFSLNPIPEAFARNPGYWKPEEADGLKIKMPLSFGKVDKRVLGGLKTWS